MCSRSWCGTSIDNTFPLKIFGGGGASSRGSSSNNLDLEKDFFSRSRKGKGRGGTGDGKGISLDARNVDDDDDVDVDDELATKRVCSDSWPRRGYPLGKYWLRHTILSRSRDLKPSSTGARRRARGDRGLHRFTQGVRAKPLEPTLSIGPPHIRESLFSASFVHLLSISSPFTFTYYSQIPSNRPIPAPSPNPSR